MFVTVSTKPSTGRYPELDNLAVILFYGIFHPTSPPPLPQVILHLFYTCHTFCPLSMISSHWSSSSEQNVRLPEATRKQRVKAKNNQVVRKLLSLREEWLLSVDAASKEQYCLHPLDQKRS